MHASFVQARAEDSLAASGGGVNAMPMQRAPLVLPAATFVLAILAEAHGGLVAFALACAGAAGFAPAATVAGLAGLAVGRLQRIDHHKYRLHRSQGQMTPRAFAIEHNRSSTTISL